MSAVARVHGESYCTSIRVIHGIHGIHAFNLSDLSCLPPAITENMVQLPIKTGVKSGFKTGENMALSCQNSGHAWVSEVR